MNSLQRVLIEKAGREHGFENVLIAEVNAVSLGSARHPVKVSIRLDGDVLYLILPEGLLSDELGRDHIFKTANGMCFPAADIAQLAQLLLRTAALAQSLPNQAAVDFETQVQDALLNLPKNGTEIERMVRQRIGQNTFRNAMLEYWGSACAVTGINVPQVLRASHAKPWAECDDDIERLDVFNGFLLNANLDALFDRFLISFSCDGRILISTKLTKLQLELLGINESLKLRWIAKQHISYLKFHHDRFLSL